MKESKRCEVNVFTNFTGLKIEIISTIGQDMHTGDEGMQQVLWLWEFSFRVRVINLLTLNLRGGKYAPQFFKRLYLWN